jgi:hypothetical protein
MPEAQINAEEKAVKGIREDNQELFGLILYKKANRCCAFVRSWFFKSRRR